MSIVSLVKCSAYDPVMIREALGRGIELLGGFERFLNPGDSILLKPNLLAGVRPERAVTTHPGIFSGVSVLLNERKYALNYGDGPGIISLRSASVKTGLDRIARELNVEEVNFSNTENKKYPDGKQHQVFEMYKDFAKFKIISLPKFKTHNLTRITGAVKNQYGFLSFRQKREFHALLKQPDQFARMLLDLNAFINPVLYILDAVQAMEGDGPMNGNPVDLGLIAISSDPVALDATLCRIIDLDPYLVDTVRLGENEGFGKASKQNIKLVGDPIQDFLRKDFKVERSRIFHPQSRSILNTLFTSLSKLPIIKEETCTGCGDCEQACPVIPKAISMRTAQERKIAKINYTYCIQCYCCSEVCMHRAIELRRKGIRRKSG